MEYYFKERLERSELKQVMKLYETQEVVSITQHPEWMPSIRPDKTVMHFYAIHEKSMICYAQIHQQKLKQAHIPFGPIFLDRQLIVCCINEICKYYRRRSYLLLTIQLPMPVGNDSEYITYYLSKEQKFKQFFNRENWTTNVIDLKESDEKILSDFSSDCRRNLKKSIKFNLRTERLVDWSEVAKFHNIFVEMYKHRKLYLDIDKSRHEFKQMLQFFKDHENGFFLGVYHEQQLIGAVTIIYQGNTAVYSHGASDPAQRNYPTLYLALFDALNHSKSEGLHYFDFGGYNHMIQKDDQVHSINKFKDNFSKHYLFYPRIINIALVPGGRRVSLFLKSLGQIYKKLKR